MQTEIVRAELERLFELPELLVLTRDLLGFDPARIGGTTTRAAFAQALTEYCISEHALEALCDVMLASKPEADNRLLAIGHPQVKEAPVHAAGDTVAGFRLLRVLGKGALGTSYLAQQGHRQFRVKILGPGAATDRALLQRFLTYVRLLDRLSLPGFPVELTAREHDEELVVSHVFVSGQSLASRAAESGPVRAAELRPLLESTLRALSALHERRLAHGNLRLENVLVRDDGSAEPSVVLLDAGFDRLRLRRVLRAGDGLGVGSPHTVSPEQIRGELSDSRSDVYAFGALLYHLLTGEPLFGEANPFEAAIGHLTRPPPAPSSRVPQGFVSKDVDAIVLALLEKEAIKRPPDAAAVLKMLGNFGRSVARSSTLPEARQKELADAVRNSPRDVNAAVALEAAVQHGLDPERAIEALCGAAEKLADTGHERDLRKALLFRAARLCEREAADSERAERLYAEILELDASDPSAAAALEEVRRKLGKYDELIELLLERSESAQSRTDRGRALAEIGRIYASDLKNPDQALLAYARALAEDVHQPQYAEEIVRIAAGRADAYTLVLNTCSEAVAAEDMPLDAKRLLLMRMADWYESKLGRSDLALPCYQTVLAGEPANDRALEGMAGIERKAQRWPELVSLLERRADIAPTPARARDLHAEAAEILEVWLRDMARARALYEQIVRDDPAHPKANQALSRIYEHERDYGAYAALLRQEAETLRAGERKRPLYCLATLYENELKNDAEALACYERVLTDDPGDVEALRGIERLLTKAGRFRELVSNLEAQLSVAATPRQKIVLLERLASLHFQEFLDRERACSALASILGIDPENAQAFDRLVLHYRELGHWERLPSLYRDHMNATRDRARLLQLTLALAEVWADHLAQPERAMACYERALELDPDNPLALASIAHYSELTGDAHAALGAIEALAAKVPSADSRAELYVRAGKLLEAQGDTDAAIERYRSALDQNPNEPAARAALRRVYLARGDHVAALKLLEHELERTSGEQARAKLYADIALVARESLHDDARAERAARDALAADPTNLSALIVLGDIAFEQNLLHEAAEHLEAVVERIAAVEPASALRVMVRYVEALLRTGATERALAPLRTLLDGVPDDLELWRRMTELVFEHAAPAAAAELCRKFLERFASALSPQERALFTYRQGDALRRAGEVEQAVSLLENAADLDPSSPLPLAALAEAHKGREDWAELLRVKARQLDLAEGEARFQLLLELGEIAQDKLGDRTQAAKSLALALEERPDDRRLLTKLMQLYSEDKDWHRLVDVVLRLAEFVDEPKQKAKYLHTAAIVTNRQLGEAERALQIYEQVLALDPAHEKAEREVMELQHNRGNYGAVEHILQQRLARFRRAADVPRQIATLEDLGRLYEAKLGAVGDAITAYEAAQELDPDNRARGELLAGLYASDPDHYLEKAVAAQRRLLAENPYRPDSYRLLRRLYTQVKQADAAFCLCQALYILNLAEPEEERFYRRFRPETAAAAQAALDPEAWVTALMHHDANGLVTQIFALIEGAVLSVQTDTPDALGYVPNEALGPGEHAPPLVRSLSFAAHVLGLSDPLIFDNARDEGGLSFLTGNTKAIVLGQAALAADIPAQAAAFIAARHLSYLRPGSYLRQLVPSVFALKRWLFAALKLISPKFPVAAELEGPVSEALQVLERELSPSSRERLAELVTELLAAGAAVDLKEWVAGIDLSADRAGLLVADDLETAVEIIKASDEQSSSVPIPERLKELILFSVSDGYFALRQKLGIAITL